MKRSARRGEKGTLFFLIAGSPRAKGHRRGQGPTFRLINEEHRSKGAKKYLRLSLLPFPILWLMIPASSVFAVRLLAPYIRGYSRLYWIAWGFAVEVALEATDSRRFCLQNPQMRIIYYGVQLVVGTTLLTTSFDLSNFRGPA